MKDTSASGPEALPPPGRCTGCGACTNRCSAGALALIPDRNTLYFHPCVDDAICVRCGQCREVCPVLNPPPRDNRTEPECAALMAEDGIRLKSASGGAFPLLAEVFIEKGGVVAGAAWGEGLRAEFRCASDHRSCEGFRRSKYVQCYPDYIYREVAGHLAAGRRVLFSGCPCHVAGLYSFLRRRHKNLFTVDLFCGQTSPQALFRRYLDETWGLSAIQSWDFRIKDMLWTARCARLVLRDGSEYLRTDRDDDFLRAFFLRLLVNDCCADCSFAEIPRYGDISMGDFWGIGVHEPLLDDRKGTSAILINNDRGKELFEYFAPLAKKVRIVPRKWVMKNRLRRLLPAHPGRDIFFSLLKAGSFHDALDSLISSQQAVPPVHAGSPFS